MSMSVDNFSVREQLELDRSETPFYRQPYRRFIDLPSTRFPRVGSTLEACKYPWKKATFIARQPSESTHVGPLLQLQQNSRISIDSQESGSVIQRACFVIQRERVKQRALQN